MGVESIYIVCHTAYDVGYDQSAYRAAEMQKRELEQALQTPDFRFTMACSAPVLDYVRRADEARRRELLQAVEEGRIEVCGLSHNLCAAAGENEIKKSVEWLPAELFSAFKIASAMQVGTGGVSGAAAARLCKKGVKYLWVGLDGAHSAAPALFYWRLSVKDKLLCFVDRGEYALDKLLGGAPDADAVSELHAHLSAQLEEMDYDLSILPASFTGDIDAVRAFAARWNESGLKPALRFSTVCDVMSEIATEVANRAVPTYTGMWADAQAAVCASVPAEFAVYRDVQRRRRLLETLCAPEKILDSISRDLCVFAEHSYADVRSPGLLKDRTLAVKKYKLYTAQAKTESAPDAFSSAGPGLNVRNAFPVEYKGLVACPRPCAYVTDEAGAPAKVWYENGTPYFYATLEPMQRAVYTLHDESFMIDYKPVSLPVISTDENGFPVGVSWADGNRLDLPAFGEFWAVQIDSLTPRDVVERIFYEKNRVTRDSLISHYLKRSQPAYGAAEKTDRDYAFIYTQRFESPVLRSGTRTLTVYKSEPRVTVTLTIDRLPGLDPQGLYARFDFGQSGTCVSSNGGRAFEIARGQIPGTYADAVATDGWLAYPYAELLFLQRDTSLLSFGEDRFLAFAQEFSASGAVYATLFNNALPRGQADFYGPQTFTFDLFKRPCDDFYKDKLFADAAYTPPVTYWKGEK